MASKDEPTTQELAGVAVLVFILEAIFYAFAEAARQQYGFWIGMIMIASINGIIFFMVAKGYYHL